VAVFVVYLVANLLLAVAAFWVATQKPQHARLLWWVVGVFVLGAVGFVSYFIGHGVPGGL